LKNYEVTEKSTSGEFQEKDNLSGQIISSGKKKQVRAAHHAALEIVPVIA